ncbi:MAG: D-aminoacyl-tRNA deacylase [bacterium]|nr:D-aminoacyl-tRNA deacylase [bacterium]
MKAVLQRVTAAEVQVDHKVIARIASGVLCYISYAANDRLDTMVWMARKIADLRLFTSEGGEDKFDRSLKEIAGELLVVSNFTLHADSRKGRRPDFVDAAPPAIARNMHIRFLEVLKEYGIVVHDGEFGAHMLVSSVNDGPVTILLERDEK